MKMAILNDYRYNQRDIIKNYNVITNDQPIYSNIKRYEEIRKLTTRQGED